VLREASDVFFAVKFRLALAADAVFMGQEGQNGIRVVGQAREALEVVLDAAGLAGLEAELQVYSDQLEEYVGRVVVGRGEEVGEVGLLTGPPGALEGSEKWARRLADLRHGHSFADGTDKS
jgi:hypothetical protein